MTSQYAKFDMVEMQLWRSFQEKVNILEGA
jgi:hypothetical protein